VAGILLTLPEIPVAVLSEGTARRTGGNFGIPPSRMQRDGTARRSGAGRRRKAVPQEGGGIWKAVAEEKVAVDACSTDLSGVDPAGNLVVGMTYDFEVRTTASGDTAYMESARISAGSVAPPRERRRRETPSSA